MRLDIQAPVLSLECGEVITLDDAEGVRIQARKGVVWVTEDGEPKDHIVQPGETLVVNHAGRTVVQALAPAWLSLKPAPIAANDEPGPAYAFDAEAFLEEVRDRVLWRYY